MLLSQFTGAVLRSVTSLQFKDVTGLSLLLLGVKWPTGLL